MNQVEEECPAFRDAAFFVDGRQIPPETVERVLHRRLRRRRDASRRRRERPSGAPPPPPPHRRRPEPTFSVFLNAGGALQGVRDYIAAASKRWIWDAGAKVYLSTKGGERGRLRLSQFHDSLLFVLKVLGEGQDARACERLFCVDLADLPGILADEDPFLLADMLNILGHLHARADLRGLEDVFVGCLVSTAAQVLGAEHPLTCFWAVVEASEVGSRTDFLYCSLRVAADEFQHLVRRRRAEAVTVAIIRLHMDNIGSFLYPRQGKDTPCLRDLAGRAQMVPATDPVGLCLRLCAARRYLLVNGIEEAKAIVDEVLRQESCHQLIGRTPQLAYGFFLMLGHLCWKELKKDEAERHIQDAIKNAEVDRRNPVLEPYRAQNQWLEGMAQLEAFLRTFGEHDKADAVGKLVEQTLKGLGQEA